MRHMRRKSATSIRSGSPTRPARRKPQSTITTTTTTTTTTTKAPRPSLAKSLSSSKRPSLLLKTTREAWKSRHIFEDEKLRGEGTRRIVTYNERDAFFLLFNMYGSVWAKTLPFCVVNTACTIGLYQLDEYSTKFNLTANEAGLKYMSALLSFLVIARVKIVYHRMIEARNNLQIMYKSSQELIQHATLFTYKCQHVAAKQWRFAIALSMILTMEDTMRHMQYRSLSKDMDPKEIKFRRNSPFLKLFCLRKDLLKHRKVFVHEGEKIEMPSEKVMLGFVDTYAEVLKQVDTLQTSPFPFPLVQMARTILFFWIFSLPLGLVHDGYPIWGLGMLVFILTYGFIGLEYVSMELDDPFGDDPNDFDQIGYARDVYEDIYIMIHDVDGQDVAFDLREKVKELTKRFGAEEEGSLNSSYMADVEGSDKFTCELSKLRYSRFHDVMDDDSLVL